MYTQLPFVISYPHLPALTAIRPKLHPALYPLALVV